MVPCLHPGGFLHHCKALVMVFCISLSMIHVSIYVANNFVHSSTAADQGYHAFGELTRFDYCLLKKFRRRHHCPLWNNGKVTLSLIIRGSLQLMIKTFSLVPVWWPLWTKLVAITCRQNFVVMPVAFSKSLWIVSFQPLLRDPSLDRAWAASALQLWLVGMTSLHSKFLPSSWMGCSRRIGPGGAKLLRRAGLSTSPLCRNSGSWSGRPRGRAPT